MKDLMQKNIWICWNYKEVNGRKTKVPISAAGQETGTDPGHSGTWTDYITATEGAIKNRCDGVGLVIPAGYFLLDLDHQGQDDPEVQTFLDRFQTLTEESPSGHGLHLYGKCDLDRIPTRTVNGRLKLAEGYRQRIPRLELYIGGITNRFSTYTGATVRDLSVADCTDAVLETLNTELKKPDPIPARQPDPDLEPSGESDADMIEGLKHQKNGPDFIALFDQGDISRYPSRSEADLALCAFIAFRTGPDPAAIDRIFRQSALFRTKWLRADYRNSTITKAINTRNYYSKYYHGTAGQIDWDGEIND